MKLTLMGRALLLTGCLVVASVALAQATRSEMVPLRQPLEQLPMNISNWQGRRAADLEPEVLQLLGVSEYLNRVYHTNESTLPVGLYIGYYHSQREGVTMHSPMNCLPGSGWQPISSGRADIALSPEEARATGAVSPMNINRYIVQKGGESLLVYYWYQSHGRVVASEYWGKVYTVLDSIRMNRTDAAMVRVVVPVAGSDAAAEQRAESLGSNFIRQMFPLLVHHLPL